MYDACTCCGVGFAREHGQWVGSLDINTFVVAFILMIGVAFGPNWSLPVSLAVYGGAAIVGAPRDLPVQPRRVDRDRAPDGRGVLIPPE
jgi:hypothetical protein